MNAQKLVKHNSCNERYKENIYQFGPKLMDYNMEKIEIFDVDPVVSARIEDVRSHHPGIVTARRSYEDLDKRLTEAMDSKPIPLADCCHILAELAEALVHLIKLERRVFGID